MKLAAPFCILLIAIITSCTYDNEEAYYSDVCDTLNVTYAGTVKQILQANCLGCHFNNNLQTGIELQDYSDVKERVEDGSLLGSISHAPGFEPMPQNGEMLGECSISQVRKWIETGAPNN